RCPGCGIPASERLRILDVPLRLADRAVGLPHPAGSCGLRLDRLRSAEQHDVHARCRRKPLVLGLALQGFGTILSSVNLITTILTMRAPGMTMFRMPIFSWNTLITGILVLMAFQPLAA